MAEVEGDEGGWRARRVQAQPGARAVELDLEAPGSRPGTRPERASMGATKRDSCSPDSIAGELTRRFAHHARPNDLAPNNHQAKEEQ